MPRLADILRDIERWSDAGDDVAVATVVSVRGSSPRPAGARLAVSRSGRMSGAVSAGCVESDVHRRALDVLDRGEAVVARFSPAEAPELGVALTCGGAIEVLIEPACRSAVLWRALADALDTEKPVTLAEIIEPPALRGAKALVDLAAQGATFCPVLDGGFPEELLDAVRSEAVALSRTGRGAASILDLAFLSGRVRVFLQTVLPAPRLIVVGAGDVAAAMSALAKRLGMRVAIVDPRTAFVEAARAAEADDFLCAWPQAAIDPASLGDADALVTLTHDPKIDIPALEIALRSSAGYVGALGSRRTHEKRKAALSARGFSASDIARIHGPVGLDIGGTSAEELALSIVAEIVAARNGRDARSRPFVSGIVLAAGVSMRMGCPKQLLPLAGKPLLQHVVDAAAAAGRLDEVVVVLGAHADEIRRALALPPGGKVRTVVNERPERGMAESLRCGLAAIAARATDVAILLGDQPETSAALIDHVVAAHAAAGKPATRPVFGGPGSARTPGHPVVMGRALWPALRELERDEGARSVLAARPDELHEVRMVSPAPVDIDTPEDYARAAEAALRR